MEVTYASGFFRTFNALTEALQEEIADKVADFKDPANHKTLKVHKLSGRLKGRYAFSVNYKTRVIFMYTDTKPKEAILLSVGDHDIYN